MSEKRSFYYTRRERAKLHSEKVVSRFARRVVEMLGKPYEEKRRGRKANLSPTESAVLILTMVVFNKTFRDSTNTVELLFTQTTSYVSVWRYFHNIPPEYIAKGVKRLFFLLIARRPHILYVIADSTGISFDRAKGWMKNHIVVAWLPNKHITPILCCKPTDNRIRDLTVGYELLRKINWKKLSVKIYFLADGAFFSKKFRTFLHLNGLVPIISEPKTAQCKRRFYKFSKHIFKWRKVIEGVFGGMAIRYGNKTRCKIPEHREKWVLLMNLAHNLREWMCINVKFNSFLALEFYVIYIRYEENTALSRGSAFS